MTAPVTAIEAIGRLYDVIVKKTEWPSNDHSIKSLTKHIGFTWCNAYACAHERVADGKLLNNFVLSIVAEKTLNAVGCWLRPED